MQETAGQRPVVVLTGASGYIGRVTAKRFVDHGWRVIALCRSEPQVAGVEHIRWHLGDHSPIAAIGPDAVVHLASATMVSAPSCAVARADLRGFARLLAEFRAIGRPSARLILVSSQSARRDAANLYGRIKHRQERQLRGAREICVRPGLVYGGEDRGVYRMLARLLSWFPVLPALRTDAVFHPIHVDDLADALYRCANASAPLAIYHLGQRDALTFADLARSIAARNGRRCLVIQLPGFVTAFARRAGGISSVARSAIGERINGLLHLRAMDTSASLAALALPLRRMAREPRTLRGGRIAIALAMLAYVGGTRPRLRCVGIGPIKRLVRLIENDPEASAIRIPRLMQRMPSLLRLIEAPGDRDSPHSRALVAACWVHEMAPGGLARFTLERERTRLRVAASLVATIVAEVALLPARLAVAPWFRPRKPPAKSDRRLP